MSTRHSATPDRGKTSPVIGEDGHMDYAPVRQAAVDLIEGIDAMGILIEGHPNDHYLHGQAREETGRRLWALIDASGFGDALRKANGDRGLFRDVVEAASDLGVMVSNGLGGMDEKFDRDNEALTFHPPEYDIAPYRSACNLRFDPEAYKDNERVHRAVYALRQALEAAGYL